MSDFRYGPPSANGSGAFFAPPRGPALPPHLQRMNGAMPPHLAMAMAVPAYATPLPAGWSEHVTPQGLRYYYNASTGVSTYEMPTASAVVPGTTATAVNNASSSAVPAVPAVAITWVEYKDDASGLSYYYNTVTKATTWDQPEEFRMQQARVEVEKMKSSTAASGVVEAEEQRKRDHKKQQADEEAMEQFETMAKDDRVAAFKNFLEEKQVSPQFKWQELLRFLAKEGLDKDARWKFALATVGEKKQAFSEYCSQAVNKQNIERRRQAKRIREEFLELLGNMEDRMLQGRVTWEDVSQGAEFYGLRKDPRWVALEEGKDKRDLFESTVQDVLRKKEQLKAKQVEDFKHTFLAKLRETATQDAAVFAGKRRLDGELKKKVWHLVEELQGPKSIAKHAVYEWTESFLDVLKTEESEQSKAEREKKKQAETAFVAKLQQAVGEWLSAKRITICAAWKDASELVAKEISVEGVSERRQRRVFEKTMKLERERLKTAAELVADYTGGFPVTESTTFSEFALKLRTGVESRGIVRHEDEATRQYVLELETSIKDGAPLPQFVEHVFAMLQYAATRSKGRSRSPSIGGRKRRRSSVESPRHRSRSRSHSRRSFYSVPEDPRAAVAMTSYRDLPPSPSHRAVPTVAVMNETERASEIIRQARLKLVAKQEAKQRGDAHESEPEEGEEVEDGEIEE